MEGDSMTKQRRFAKEFEDGAIHLATPAFKWSGDDETCLTLYATSRSMRFPSYTSRFSAHRHSSQAARPSSRGGHAWRVVRVSGLAVSLFTSLAASAANYPTRSIGSWIVSESSDQKGCFVSRTYPAPRQTTLQFGLDTDGANRLTILNAHWSIRPRERLTMDFRLSNAAFPRHDAIGIATQGKKGFVTSFGRTFPTNLAASRFLHIRRGAVPIEELSLDGSGAAIAELSKCVGRSSMASAVPTRKDDDRIPADPVASEGKRDSRR